MLEHIDVCMYWCVPWHL